MIQYIDKPIEEMTLDELKAERRVHIWVARSLERLRAILLYRYEHYNEPDIAEELAQLKADYFDELIDDKEFARGRQKARRTASVHERHHKEAKERAEFALIVARAHRGFVAEIEEQINKVKYPEKPKERKLPKVYGYDPRKNRSKNNYQRDDWGETRKNRKKHLIRKGQLVEKTED